MPHAFLRAAVALTALVPATACGALDLDRPTATRTTPAPPPPPTPAVTKAEATRVLARYAAQVNAANGRLSPSLAKLSSTGSTLEMQTAKYKVFKANRLRIGPYKYGSALAAAPKFSAYPKWFFAALTDRGSKPYTRDIVVLVQERQGARWRAAYTPLATSPVTGPLARGIDVADFPDVVPQADASLVLPPGRLPGAVADVINQGSGSRDFRAMTIAPWMKTKHQNLRDDRQIFKKSGWTGSATYSAASTPVYAVRTTSGGALAWFGVELKEAFRHTARGNGITWEHDNWGDLLRPFTGRSTVTKTLTTVDRIEVLAYVPPAGKGTIRFLATRWAPIRIQGR